MYAPLAWLGPGNHVADAAVVTEGAAIVYAGPRAGSPPVDEAIELDGFLMPAAADRHVHISTADPAAVLSRGVTAVRDLGWPADEIFPLADASEGPSFNGPLIRAAGPMLTAPGGYPIGGSWAPPHGTGMVVASPDDAMLAVDYLAGRGAAQIKVALNAEWGPTVSDVVLATICEAAAGHELPVTAHAQGPGQVERALGAGVDELAHTPWTESLSENVIDAMAKTMRIVSTLDMLSLGNDTPGIRIALDNLRKFAGAGGAVSYGTDLGNSGIPPGIDTRELMLLREAGLDTEAVMRTLIRAPLEEGAPADLIGLSSNPFEDLGAFEDLLLVMRAGEAVVAVDG